MFRFGAYRITRNRAGAIHTAEKRDTKKMSAAEAGQAPRGRASRKNLLEMSRYYEERGSFRTS